MSDSNKGWARANCSLGLGSGLGLGSNSSLAQQYQLLARSPSPGCFTYPFRKSGRWAPAGWTIPPLNHPGGRL